MTNFITTMKTNLTMYLLQASLNFLSTEKIRQFVDDLLKYITTNILNSSSKIDDNLLFPIIGALRAMLSLPTDVRIDTRTLSAITAAIMGLLDPSKCKEFVDSKIDYFEDCIQKSETVLDDKFVLPILRSFRVAFDIPDNDEEKK